MIDQKGHRLILYGIFLFYAFWIPGLALAQEGTISGRVTDPAGGVVPGVTITVANVGTGIKVTTLTNSEGRYVVPFLPPGNYQVETAMSGFKPLVRSGIKLDVQQVLRIDLALEVGAPDQEINVVATTPPLERETSSVGQVIENKTIVTLPLNGRNYSQLALLAPGAVPTSPSTATDGFSLNGNRTFQNSFLVDGINNTNNIVNAGTGSNQVLHPSIDAIQEFKVETANYSAEFGRAAGGVISVSIKSGTNQLHGSAFEFLRNEALDANDFFANRSGLRRPPLRYHQFGGTVGGPVWRQRTFFFVSYQGTRNHRSDTITTTVPSPEMVQGRFGSVMIYDPLQVVGGQRQPFPNNVIPESRMDPVGRRIAALYPAPNLPGSVNNYAANVASKDDNNQYDLRVDHRLRDADNLFGRYSWAPRETSHGSLFGPPGNGGAVPAQLPVIMLPKAQSLAVGETHVFSSALVNEGRAGYSRIEQVHFNPDPRPLYEELGIQGISLYPGLTGLPAFQINGFSWLGSFPFTPGHPRAQVLQVSDTLSWVRGNHTVKLGGEGRFGRNRVDSPFMSRGVFTFSGQFTARIRGQGVGSALADLLLGQTSNVVLATRTQGDLFEHYYGFFINDTWRLSRKLTLNLGLRYELQTPMWEEHNRTTNFDADPRSPTYGTLMPSANGSIRARTFINLDKLNFAPRVGLAYEVNPKTVVRGAFGLFYGGLGYQHTNFTGLNNLPYAVMVNVVSPTTADRSALVLADGAPRNALDPQNVRNPAANSLSPNLHMPQIYQWHLGVQREWLADMVLSLAYVGSSSLHIHGMNDINAPVPGPGAPNPRRPFPTFGTVRLYDSFAHATYHAMQAKVERRFRQGFSLLTSYTWSHAIDNIAELGDVDLGVPTMPQNPNNLRAEKASASAIDVRHRCVGSIIYDLPIGRKGGRIGNVAVVRALLSGWQVGGIFVAQSGPPMTPTVAGNPANTTTPQRPDRIGDGNLPRGARTVDRWFDPSAFAPAAQYTFGNSGRNVLRAPGLVNLDLLVARHFPITEAKHLELRGELFNVTNSAHFGPPDLTINQPQAGRITATQLPNRQVQIGLRFVF